MKRSLFFLAMIFTLLLAGCNLSLPSQDKAAPSQPTLSADELVQTQLAEMLATLPTNTPEPLGATPTAALATISAETQEPAAGVVATATPEIATATAGAEAATPEPQPTATQTPLVSFPTASPTMTPTINPSFTPAPGDPRTRLGSPSSTDPMNNERTWIWPTGRDQYTTGEFRDGYMVMTALSDVDGWRMANPLDREFTNLYLEADFRTQTCEGSDHYGLIFRVPVLREPDQGYLFGLTCDGRYSLRRWDGRAGTKGEMQWLVRWTGSSSIITGSNQGNRMGVMMIGSRMFLYINGQLVTEVQDATFDKGYFGVFVGSDKTPNMQIQVDNMAYWENPNP
jgi:hypothetical protein